MSIRGVGTPARGSVLGRDAELAQIAAWLRPDTGDGGHGPAAGPGILAIEGEPGIGKTTLWAEAVGRARQAGWQVLSCRPAFSDAGLPHVGLADMLGGVPDEALGGFRRRSGGRWTWRCCAKRRAGSTWIRVRWAPA